MSTASSPKQFYDRPVGRRSSDIVGSWYQNGYVPQSPCLVKNYNKSQIFTEDCSDSTLSVKLSAAPRSTEKTKDRLFGTVAPNSSPRRQTVSDTYRSNVFCEGDGSHGYFTRKKTGVNPISGDKLTDRGDVDNHCEHESSQVKFNRSDYRVKKVRQPPGGFSHGLW